LLQKLGAIAFKPSNNKSLFNLSFYPISEIIPYNLLFFMKLFDLQGLFPVIDKLGTGIENYPIQKATEFGLVIFWGM